MAAEFEDDWFHMLVLHQNRARHGSKSYTGEHLLPDFLDLVFWGHEHECRVSFRLTFSFLFSPKEDGFFSIVFFLFCFEPFSSLVQIVFFSSDLYISCSGFNPLNPLPFLPASPPQIEPEDYQDKFRVIQPGSSVATSLCPAEAVPKHVGLLKVYKKVKEFTIDTGYMYFCFEMETLNLMLELCITCRFQPSILLKWSIIFL